MPGKDVIANNLPIFNRDIEKMENLVTQLESVRSRLFNELAALNDMWEGPAHDGLMARFNADNTFAEEFIKFLKDVTNDYREAHKAYSDCEARIAETISSMNLEV